VICGVVLLLLPCWTFILDGAIFSSSVTDSFTGLKQSSVKCESPVPDADSDLGINKFCLENLLTDICSQKYLYEKNQIFYSMFGFYTH
jgi:hypothetical protein